MPRPISRRAAARQLFGAAAGSTFLARPARAARLLRVVAPQDYADAAWIKRFERQAGATVSVTAVADTGEALARLQAGRGADCDVVALDLGAVAAAWTQGLLRPIETLRLRSLGGLQPAFRRLEALRADGRTYAVPFAWSALPLIYDAAGFPDGPPPSWTVLWERRYAQQIIVPDDAVVAIVTAALALGLDRPFALSPDQLALVRTKLVELKGLALTTCSGVEDGVAKFAQGGVKLMPALDIRQAGQLRARGIRADIALPREGAVGSIDCWAVCAGANDLDLAHRWLDLMLGRDIGADLALRHGRGSATDAATSARMGFAGAERLVFRREPADLPRWRELWEGVKAAPS